MEPTSQALNPQCLQHVLWEQVLLPLCHQGRALQLIEEVTNAPGPHAMSSNFSQGSKNKASACRRSFHLLLSSLQFPWLLFPFPSSPLMPQFSLVEIYGSSRNIPLASRAHATLSHCHWCLLDEAGEECENTGRKTVLRGYSPEERLLTMGLALALWGALALTPGSPSSLILQSPRGTSVPHRQLAQSTCMARTQELRGSPTERTDWFFHLNSIPKHRLLIEKEQ